MRKHVDLYQLLSQQLHPEERLLWWGSPDTKRLTGQCLFFLPRGDWAPRKWVLMLLLLGEVIQTTHVVFVPSWAMALFWGLVFCFLVGAYILHVIGALRTRHGLQQTAYAVTDRRAIILSQAGRLTITSFAPYDLGAICSIEYADDWGDVLFGPRRGGRRRFRRRVARGGFHRVPCVRQVTQLLQELQAQQQPCEE